MPFREEHIQYFPTLASLRTPRLMYAVGWMLAPMMFGVIAFLMFTPWVQTVAGSGSVTALNPNDRLQEINALVSGRIQEWYVQDGSSVKTGDPIVRIIDNDPLLIERLQAERAQVEVKFIAAQSAKRTAALDLDRTNRLFNEGLAARRDVELAQIKVEELRTKTAEAAAELNRVDVNISRQSAQIVRAPRDGVILRVNAGDTATFVSAGEPIATFIPLNVPRAIEVFVDGRDVVLIQPGAKVRIQFEGWPAVQFSGWPSVAVGTFPGEVRTVDPSADATGRFRVLITEISKDSDQKSWPDPRFVRFGSAARAWILLETVPAGYELWRQLNNFPPQFPEGGAP